MPNEGGKTGVRIATKMAHYDGDKQFLIIDIELVSGGAVVYSFSLFEDYIQAVHAALTKVIEQFPKNTGHPINPSDVIEFRSSPEKAKNARNN